MFVYGDLKMIFTNIAVLQEQMKDSHLVALIANYVTV